MRYVATTEDAKNAVRAIERLIETEAVEPTISFDIETQPKPGYQGYPGTVYVDGQAVRATSRHYLEYAQRVALSWGLCDLGLSVPKTTSGTESVGVKSKEAWADFSARLAAVSDADLEAARLSVEAVQAFFDQMRTELSDLRTRRDALEGVRGKKTAQKALDKEAEHLETMLRYEDEAVERAAVRFPVAMFRHIVLSGVENRGKKDPVRPGLDPYTTEIFTVQVSLRERGAGTIHTWVFNTVAVELDALQQLFTREDVTYLAHNAQFDLKFLAHTYGWQALPQDVFCTMTASRMLYLGLKNFSHSLAACLERFLNRKMDKTVRTTFIGVRRTEPTREQIEYGAYDTEVLFALRDKEMDLARRRGAVEAVEKFGRLSLTAAVWELVGFDIDRDEWMTQANRAAEIAAQLATELEQMLLPADYVALFGAPDGEAGGEDAEADADEDAVSDNRAGALVKITQTAVVTGLLRKLLGEDVFAKAFPEKNGVPGKVSLDKDGRGALERAWNDTHSTAHPFFTKYKEWSGWAKSASTYGRKFLWSVHPLTGKIHSTFRPAGTDTGRFSSSGPNLLNISRGDGVSLNGKPVAVDYRGAFKAPAGHYLVGADFANAEGCIMANEAQELSFKKLIESGADAHSFVAALAFHIRQGPVSSVQREQKKVTYGPFALDLPMFTVPDTWTNDQLIDFALTAEVLEAVLSVPKKQTRQFAKQVTFLNNYGGSAFTLHARTGIPLEVCEQFFERYNYVYPRTAEYKATMAERLLAKTVNVDGVEYASAVAYMGIRRWFQMPRVPQRRNFDRTEEGEEEYWEAKRAYKRRLLATQREGINVPCQAGNAAITTDALLDIDRRGRALGIRPYIAVYDEIILAVPESVPYETAKELLETAMRGAADRWCQFVKIGADAGPKADRWVKS